jgi:hypothetical protein
MTLNTLSTDLNPKADFNKLMEPTFVDVAKKVIGIKPLLKHKVKDVQSKFFIDTAKFISDLVDKV